MSAVISDCPHSATSTFHQLCNVCSQRFAAWLTTLFQLAWALYHPLFQNTASITLSLPESYLLLFPSQYAHPILIKFNHNVSTIECPAAAAWPSSLSGAWSYWRDIRSPELYNQRPPPEEELLLEEELVSHHPVLEELDEELLVPFRVSFILSKNNQSSLAATYIFCLPLSSCIFAEPWTQQWLVESLIADVYVHWFFPEHHWTLSPLVG